jgi:hypothetical protein
MRQNAMRRLMPHEAIERCHELVEFGHFQAKVGTSMTRCNMYADELGLVPEDDANHLWIGR